MAFSSLVPHGPLEPLEENLWVVKSRLRSGPPLDRKMVVVKTRGGDLFVHNAVLLDAETTEQLDALGPVRTIFTPNPQHDMDGAAMKARYPEADLCALAGTHAKLHKKWPSLVPLRPEEAPPPVTLVPLPGLKHDENVMEVQTARGVTQVYTDALFNLSPGTGVMGTLLNVLGSTGYFGMTPLGKLFFLKSRADFASYLRAQMVRTDVVRVVVAHGAIVEGAAAVKRAYEGAAARLS